jgi:hypothetical protein
VCVCVGGRAHVFAFEFTSPVIITSDLCVGITPVIYYCHGSLTGDNFN